MSCSKTYDADDINSKIILVTGGARSGKSSFAEKLITDLGEKIAYIATAVPFDEGMKDRIKKHRESRPKDWTTYEIYKDIYKHIEDISKEHDAVLLDCITILVTNLMLENHDIDWDNADWEKIDEIEVNIKNQIELLIKNLRNSKMACVIVTNELGMGIVPENRLSRIFRDIAGRINQYVASNSDEAYLAVSGIPVKIK